MLAEAKTTLLLIKRDHTSTFGCVNSLQHGNYLIHLWPLIWSRIPAFLHHVCERTWAASRYFWSQILKFQQKINHNVIIMDSLRLKWSDNYALLKWDNKSKQRRNYTWRTTAEVISEKLRSGYGMSQQYVSHKQIPKLYTSHFLL